MAIRMINSTLWERDWYLDLEGKYQLFVHYLRDHCDHAGVWQPAFKMFERVTGFKINSDDFLVAVNKEVVRILVLKNGKWWMTGFIEDQYRTKYLGGSNPHKGVINSLRFNEIPYNSYGYNLTLPNPSVTLPKGMATVKDKDKDRDSISCIKDRGVGEEKTEPIIYEPQYKTQYLRFKEAYPKNGSTIDPAVESWFYNREQEKSGDAEIAIEAAKDFSFYWRLKEPETFPNSSYIKQAINWLREKQYLILWKDKAKALSIEISNKPKQPPKKPVYHTSIEDLYK
jgi:hypothetical protein